MAYIASYFQTQFKGCIIFAQIGFKFSILPQKIYFGKIDCYHYIPTVYLHATTFKKIHKEQIIRQKVPDWTHINPKGDF